jgi:hypothetical protein
MLTTPRAVTEPVRICAGLAAPIRIGPTGSASASTLATLIGDVGGVEIGEDQHVGHALQRGLLGSTRSRKASERRYRLHFAVAFQIRGTLADERSALRILSEGACRIPRAEIRMREQGDLGLDAEARDMARRQHRHVGDFLGRRIVLDMGVGEEGGALVGDDQGHRRDVADARRQADDVLDVPQPRRYSGLPARRSCVGFAAHHGQRRDHRLLVRTSVRAASGVTPRRPAMSR